jgi:hypothetical protein
MVQSGPAHLVYDSGCFHHLPPHRRKDYVDLVDRARVRELRQMRETDGKDTCFGQGFLWVLLVSKRR